MPYTFKFRLQEAPSATLDGTGVVILTILAVSSTGGAFTPVDGYSRTVELHCSDVKRVMDLPDGTPTQKTAKTQALKELIRLRTGDHYSAGSPSWTVAGLTAWVLANDSAALQAARVNTYLTTTLGQSYPIDFNL